MVSVAQDLKSIFAIESKPRYDTLTDEYNRIFMVKLLLVCSFVMSLSWYQDEIQCIVPDNTVNDEFVSPACWIQGMYVYKELQTRVDYVAYFGIPMNMDAEGMMKGTDELCHLRPKLNEAPHPDCEPMTKTFFLQYQYMPFLIGALTVIYYLPYVLFRVMNSDMNMLKDVIAGEEKNADAVVRNFFHVANPNLKSERLSQIRGFMILVCKISYVLSNAVTFFLMDKILNGEYFSYGIRWFNWSRLENSMAYDYMGGRDIPKPGNLLLPPFGYCELYESSKDIKITTSNRHKFVCELSQHILYQYCLYVLWAAIIVGIVVSLLGVVQLLLHYAFSYLGVRNKSLAGKKLMDQLRFREVEYLEFMRRKDLGLFEDVVMKLREILLETNPSPKNNVNEEGGNSPPYPHLSHLSSPMEKRDTPPAVLRMSKFAVG